MEAINPGSVAGCFVWERAHTANTESEIYEKYIFQEQKLVYICCCDCRRLGALTSCRLSQEVCIGRQPAQVGQTSARGVGLPLPVIGHTGPTMSFHVINVGWDKFDSRLTDIRSSKHKWLPPRSPCSCHLAVKHS